MKTEIHMITKVSILFALVGFTMTIIGPAHAQHKMQMGVSPASVAFPAGKDVVELDFEMDRDKIVIPVRVNGSEPMRWVLDSGAPISVLLAPKLAEGLNLDIVGQVQIAGLGEGDGGSAPLATVTLDIGGMEVTNESMTVGIGEGDFPETGLEGIIGGSLFTNLVVDLDFENKKIRFYPPDKFDYDGNGTTLPLSISGGFFSFVDAQVVIDGEEPVTASLVIDTGASHALSLHVGSKAGLHEPTTTVDGILGWGAVGVIRGRTGRITSLQIGDYRLRDVDVNFPNAGTFPILSSTNHGNLGIRVLKRFRAIFDYSTKRLILEPTAELAAPFIYNRTGMTLRPTSPGSEWFDIAAVTDASPAHKAGIEPGDRLTAINGEAVATINHNDILDTLRQAPGTVLVLTIRRGEQEFKMEIVLADMI